MALNTKNYFVVYKGFVDCEGLLLFLTPDKNIDRSTHRKFFRFHFQVSTLTKQHNIGRLIQTVPSGGPTCHCVVTILFSIANARNCRCTELPWSLSMSMSMSMSMKKSMSMSLCDYH